MRNVNEVATAEVAAAPALAGPEQVAVLGGRAGAGHAIRGDDLDRLEIVAGQAEGAGQHADAAAQGQPGHADGGAGPAGDGQAARGQPLVHVDEVQAGADLDRSPGHPEGVHRGDVHDEAAVGAGPPGVAVPAGPGGHRQPELPHEGQAGAHVPGGGAVGDAGRVQHVEPGVEEFLGRRVGPLAGADQMVRGQRPAQRLPVGRPRPGLRRRPGERAAGLLRAGRPQQAPGQPAGQRDRSRSHPGQGEEPAAWRRPLVVAVPGRRPGVVTVLQQVAVHRAPSSAPRIAPGGRRAHRDSLHAGSPRYLVRRKATAHGCVR